MFVIKKTKKERHENREAYILLTFYKVNCKQKHLLNSDPFAELNQNRMLPPITLSRLESCEGVAAEMLSTMEKDE